MLPASFHHCRKPMNIASTCDIGIPPLKSSSGTFSDDMVEIGRDEGTISGITWLTAAESCYQRPFLIPRILLSSSSAASGSGFNPPALQSRGRKSRCWLKLERRVIVQIPGPEVSQ